MKAKKYELLAPAGNFEKLQIALHYGADAVYMGIPELSLRGKMKDMNLDVLKESIDYVKKQNKKIYVTMNIFPHNKDLPLIVENLNILEEWKPHAIIFSDPAVLRLAKKYAPSIPLHISTQANVTNVEAAKFWVELGVERIILAREVSIEEIKQFREELDCELEAFVHGSLCIAYSGKCYMSAYMANRSANKGECTNSCRWKYTVYYLKEETRDGQFFPVYEDDRGTYVMSSKDLCMIEHLPLLVEAGVNSFKIEGRMKGINYLAGVVKTYREAIDSIEKQNFILQEKWLKELNMFSNRGYTTGMYFGPHPDDGYQHHGRSRNTLELGLAGVVQQVDDDGVWLLARDKIYINDSIVFLRNGLEEEIFTIKEIRTSNKSMELLKNAEIAKLILDKPIPNVQPLDIARKIKEPILQK
ncbi:MAG: U32 family peptidase [Leptospiraceae bacterium]|jgi:putative protease|nr:U32 family peptidase [Leptospiraceae bacterium]